MDGKIHRHALPKITSKSSPSDREGNIVKIGQKVNEPKGDAAYLRPTETDLLNLFYDGVSSYLDETNRALYRCDISL